MIPLAAGLVRHQSPPAVLLALAAHRWPDRAAVVDDAGTVTIRELHGRVRMLAGVLHARGIGRGSTVGLMCRNHVGLVEAVFAALWVDADLALLDPELGADQLRAVGAGGRLDLLIHDADLQRVVVRSDIGVPTLVSDGHGSGSVPGACDFGHPAPPRRRHTGQLVSLASDTTGTSQGVRRRSQSAGCVGQLGTTLRSVGLRGGDPVLLLPALVHGSGPAWLVVAIAHGCPVVLMRRPDAGAALRAVQRHRARVMVAAPDLLGRVLDVPDDVRGTLDLTSLHAVLSVSAPLDPTLAPRIAASFGDRVFSVLGPTEAGSSTTPPPPL